MLRVMRFFQQFMRGRWYRLGNEQMTAIWTMILVAYLVLGLQLLIAWLRVKVVRILYSDDAVRSVASGRKHPNAKSPAIPRVKA